MFDAGDVVERLIATVRRLSQDQAVLLADLVEVADATPNPEFAGYEISCALTWTRRAADIQLDLAETIVRRLPAVLAAMAAGEIDLPKARVIADGVAALDLDLARSIAAEILPLAPGLTTGQLRPRLARLVIKADPQAAAKRRKAKVRKRRVELQPTEDSCANLLGLDLPAEDALAASNRLTAIARAMKLAGDPRSLDQLRADTFLNLLRGNTCNCQSHTATLDPHHEATDRARSSTHAAERDQPHGPADGAEGQGPADRDQPHGPADGAKTQGPAERDQPHGPAERDQPHGPADGAKTQGPAERDQPHGPADGAEGQGPADRGRAEGQPMALSPKASRPQMRHRGAAVPAPAGATPVGWS